MTDPTQGDGADSVDSPAGPDVRSNSVGAEGEGVAPTEAYEQDGQVVIYDTENPLAWIEAGEAVDLEQMA